MRRLFTWHLIFLTSALLQAGSLEPGLIGEFFVFKNEIKDFPGTDDSSPVVKCVSKTIHYELPNLPFFHSRFVTKFAIHWSGTIRISQTGTYIFFLESDDGSRLFLDETELISNGGVHGMIEKSAESILPAGDHAVRIEYFQNRYGAGCNFAWRPPDSDKQIVPENVLFHDPAAFEPPTLKPGLVGEYFSLHQAITNFPADLAEIPPTFTHVDSVINFETPNKPFPVEKLNKHFYVRWTGRIRIPKEGTYIFSLESDDGSRLFLDDKEVISNGGTHGMKAESSRLSLTGGEHDLRIEYFQNQHGAGCNLAWESESRAKEIVPAEVLFH